MKTVPVVIIGGGLSGLCAAFLLEKRGVDYVLLEARDTLGGRILAGKPIQNTTSNPVVSDSTFLVDQFDLGPSWFWPEYQQQFDRLLKELHLHSFAQFEEGDMMVERVLGEAVQRTTGFSSSPTSMRINGGMTALIQSLYNRLEPSRVMTNQIVRKISKVAESIVIECENDGNEDSSWRAQHLLLALPPRLVSETIIFEPALPVELKRQWHHTATWMAPHAKYFAVYDHPFWREQGLSGAARSAQGPMVEMHDASIPEGSAALFGFIGIPASTRQNMSDDVLKMHCRVQLVRLFGTQAATPTREYLKDWSKDKFTATNMDASSDGQHSVAPNAQAISGVWKECLTGIGSEWSLQFSGYLAGAVDAAHVGVQGLAIPNLHLNDKVPLK